MKSCLYRARVMHHRLEPKKHYFIYNVFMFYLDLDEIDTVAKKMLLISRNRFNVFNFRDKDHLQLPKDNPDKTKNIKQHILDYLKTNDVELMNPKIMLMTNLATFGYQFNPVSFYYCYGGDELQCCVVEISNTFHEMKLFFIGKENLKENRFHLNTKKYFYVSPFIEHDANFDFNLEVPGEKLNIRIDDYKNMPSHSFALRQAQGDNAQGDSAQRRIFISTLTGTKKEMTNARLFWYAFRFPLITLQVIGLIHWNAFKLWLKKVKFYKKGEHKDLQRDVLKPYKE